MANLGEGAIRRRVSYAQLEALCEFLNSHRGIAVGYNKSAQARDYSRRMWETVAEILNAMGEGAVKTWKGWSTYWVDYKAKLKRKCANIRMSRSQTGGGVSTEPPLTEVDQRFIQLLGEGFGTGLPGVRIDPFENTAERGQVGDPESAILDQNQSEQLASTSTSPDTPLLLVVENEEYVPENILQSEISLEEQEPAAVGNISFDADGAQGETTSHSGAGVGGLRGGRTIQRRNRRKFTAEAARRLLVESSQRRTELEQANHDTLQRLANAAEGINETLRQILASFRPNHGAAAAATNAAQGHDA